MKNYFLQKNRACPQCIKHSFCRRVFTLVETLVALAIFTTSLLGIMSILSSSISSTYYARQKIVASYLAQEGIEYIRNMRDTYVLYSATGQDGWNAFNTKLTPCDVSGNGCFFNADNLSSLSNPITNMPMTNLPLTLCSTTACSDGNLFYDSTTGKYGFFGEPTVYTRKIIVSIISSDETRVSSTVSWTQGSGNYSIVFTEDLFNWVE